MVFLKILAPALKVIAPIAMGTALLLAFCMIVFIAREGSFRMSPREMTPAPDSVIEVAPRPTSETDLKPRSVDPVTTPQGDVPMVPSVRIARFPYPTAML